MRRDVWGMYASEVEGGARVWARASGGVEIRAGPADGLGRLRA